MAWLSLAIMGALFLIGFVLRAVIQARRTGDAGVRRDGLTARIGSNEWWGSWLFVLALVALVAAPIAELAGLPPWIESSAVRWAGAAIATIGTLLMLLAQVDMGDSWRVGVDEHEETDLVIGGWFRVVRNPIFSALLVTAAGLSILVCNPFSVTGFVLLLAAIEIQVRRVEEPYLLATHPDTYPAYAARVGRFVPGVGLLRGS